MKISTEDKARIWDIIDICKYGGLTITEATDKIVALLEGNV